MRDKYYSIRYKEHSNYTRTQTSRLDNLKLVPKLVQSFLRLIFDYFLWLSIIGLAISCTGGAVGSVIFSLFLLYSYSNNLILHPPPFMAVLVTFETIQGVTLVYGAVISLLLAIILIFIAYLLFDNIQLINRLLFD